MARLIESSSFKGQLVSDMDRNQLLDFIEYLSTELLRYRTPIMARTIALGKVEAIRRGLD
jgi:hypothetical protein